ncbi:MAG: UvrD-helicase domain-containing protein [Desulfobacteraceae bacterium]|nr:UvrD-helicase domain-containing protein [Desulfobacteraceae bacterium]
MEFVADFHIHSKYSRATAKNLDLENLYINAQLKGITVLGTGDFTHPGWWRQIRQKLVRAEGGLFKLNESIARQCDQNVPPPCRRDVRFMLVTEISNIYKKADKTRKNHNLVFLPDLDSAQTLINRLDKIGNIRSDGRPILGLDARNLLEIVLETSDEGYLIPAHIWTPWFSLLGSKSGFDCIEECFEDLSHHIFALETGLSSDPPMNWRVSSLDRFALVSNSDAHSPAKLGREANLFDTNLSYGAIKKALEGGEEGFLGTIEFFPEEGKYHLDGHRKCGFRSMPAHTNELDKICPVCAKPLTLGVLYRVEQLADRPENYRCESARFHQNLIPLEDILSEVYQVGPKTKTVTQAYQRLIQRYGSEFYILRDIPLEDLKKFNYPLVAEAILKMRKNDVHFDAGYDGEFGKVRLFNADERDRLQGQCCLFETTGEKKTAQVKKTQKIASKFIPKPTSQFPQSAKKPVKKIFIFNSGQQAALDHCQGPLIIIAGPGTGKTRTITSRITALIKTGKVKADRILAITFTNQAANEMRNRLTDMLDGSTVTAQLHIGTFHGICLGLLKQVHGADSLSIADETLKKSIMADALYQLKSKGHRFDFSDDFFLQIISKAKQQLLGPTDDLGSVLETGQQDAVSQTVAKVYQTYQDLLNLQNLVDFEDLIYQTVCLLKKDSAWRRKLQERFSCIFADEFQDINYSQYQFIRLLAPEKANLCVIGDPDQAIYGFRGSDVRYFTKIIDDYPESRIVFLSQNYRSTKTILNSSFQVIKGRQIQIRQGSGARTYSNRSTDQCLTIADAPSARSEAVAIGCSIEKLIGGTGFHAVDFGKVGDSGEGSLSFMDIAILFRTMEQGRLIRDVLESAGLPCQLASRQDWRSRPTVAKFIALLRIIAGQGAFWDLTHLQDLTSAPIGKNTLLAFKNWSYEKKLNLAAALQTLTKNPVPEFNKVQRFELEALICFVNSIKQKTAGFNLSQTLSHLADMTGHQSWFKNENFQELAQRAGSYEDNILGFLNDLALKKDTDFYHPGAQKIALLTMHAAKGLEFEVVYIAGCEQGLIPFKHHRDNGAGSIDEERRLFYVAMTRAKEQLFLTWSRKRVIYGKILDGELSPFVKKIEKDLIQHMNQTGQKKRRCEQLSLF